MKARLTTALAAIALSALLIVPTYADPGLKTRPNGGTKSSDSTVQGKVVGKDIIVAPAPSKGPAGNAVKGTKVLDKDTIIDPKTRPADGGLRGKGQLVAGLYIKQFTAKRETGRIAIPAVLGNNSDKAIDSVRYSIQHFLGGRWNEIAGGNVTVPAGGVRDVSWELKPTNDKVQLKIVVSPPPKTYSTKQRPQPLRASFALKGQKVSQVLRYGTTDWVLAFEKEREVDQGQLLGTDANKHFDKLREYGFEKKIRVKGTTGVFSDKELQQLWVRTPTTQERTFDTVEEALEFARTMKSLIKDSVGVWSRVDPQ